MKKEELITKFNEGKLDEAGISQLEKMIESGEVDPMDIGNIRSITDRVMNLSYPEPSKELDDIFYAELASRRHPAWYERITYSLNWVVRPGWRLAFYSIILLAIGYFVRPVGSGENEELVNEVREMKELMMLTMIEEESTSERLKAVNMSVGISDASEQVTSALIETLNGDPNVNVRLAALEALLVYADRPEVRMGLIASISEQESPMVQVALAEVMLGLQETRSVEDLRQLLQKEGTPPEVKERIEETIEALI